VATKIESNQNTIVFENHNYNVNIPVVSCQYHRLGYTHDPGAPGRWVKDSYSCNLPDCGGSGGYGVTHSIAHTEGTTQLVAHDEHGMAITGDIKSSEMFDFTGDAGDVHVRLSPPLDRIRARTHTCSSPRCCRLVLLI
jgi:hypothetical protein